MKKLLRLLAVLVGIVAPLASIYVYAGNSTLTYTAGQSTAIQTKVIPAFNAERCGNFGLMASCNSAALVSAGCVAETFKGVTIKDCVIYTTNAAGEQAFLQLQSNKALVDAFLKQLAFDANTFKALCLAATPTQRTNACTAVGAASDCDPCGN